MTPRPVMKVVDLDPASMGSLDPFPDSQSGSRRAEMTHKNIKMFINFIFESAGCSVLRAEGFSFSFDAFY